MPDNSREPEEGEGKLLLSLDSGWFESPEIFSQLHIIEDVLYRYEHDKGLPEHSVKAHEVFDMIIGTGTGGLLAAMLGPLKMTTQEALAALHTIHKSVFSPPRSWRTRLREFVIFPVNWLTCGHFKLNSHHTTPTPDMLGDMFTKAFQQLVERRLGKDGLSMKMNEVRQLIPSCKFAVTAMTSAHVASPIVFRSYPSRASPPDCSLIDAIRATMANARLFPAVTFGDPISQTYISADAGHPNPIETVLQESQTAFRKNQIATILSIGSGRHDIISVNG